ncbi:hypothetical protein NXV99_21250 [Bacteroides fragilis]|nr:hypothetical protein [Bacteroides fragilis]
MTEEELKIKFDHIQGIFNRCINHASQVMIDNIASKSLYFDEEQADKLEQQEYVRTADELVQLYIRYSVLNDIQYFYSVSDFFWESGFYESLKPMRKENTCRLILFHLIIPGMSKTIRFMMKNCLIFP